MFEKIIGFSIRNKIIVGMMVLGLIIAGINALQKIPLDAVPDITNNQVQVVTQSPSAAPQEVEKFITYPVEIAMANIPGVHEIRSVSRYGLSLVTIVFDEDVKVLEARQHVSEQLKLAANDIPPGLGTPELMPITTGLGEIYQYTLEVEKGYEGKYPPTELRTIQDWIVKRQLSGIPGIVEISSFGGYLKQYEVAIDPHKLKSYNLTITDVFNALSKNNQNTGGSYIEKNTNSWYIRAEGIISHISDIEKIVITTRNNVPVLVQHVAEVGFGSAPRFGALTRNGKGETVGGITLMLKGANSSQAIKNVHQRIAEVQKSLPEGVHISPYLDRSDLVERTIKTVSKNLLEGSLIVIFVLVLMIGNLRAGLIVASVIPLSMLFALVMMHIFGISANLMSLGAIDFGIVIDGAVIIVEGVLHHIHHKFRNKTLSKQQMQVEVQKTSASIYKSAAFGVLIIIVVFIPIMSLTGIEGKMFRPMAQTVSFAVLGALLLSLTYVPMMSAWVLKRTISDKSTFADKLVSRIQNAYMPLLKNALDKPKIVLGGAIVLLLITVLSFSRLGGEFIPTLEEGDMAMQMTLPPGSSLQESVKASTKAEKVLLANFPEIKQVVSKIGTAEVPTDPMSVEEADVMIILKPKDEWTSAETREELVEKMNEKLSVIAEANFDFTQPIQLRFNELMTGAKTDVAVKIFGEDMQILHKTAKQAAEIIAGIDGAADIKVEQVDGLPQLIINYNRDKTASYGIDIESLNNVIRASFAGEEAGFVFEGEKRFSLVVRLKNQNRQNVNLSEMIINTPTGQTIPLSEVATVKFEEGPMQVSRENTRRRVTIGINVRNRDVESLVKEIQQKMETNIKLPPGYYFVYGGDFENLQKAKNRLAIAVPIALLLILVLLYFTFGSVKYALLIFTAVPLSAVGGVAALWLRDMPFSISAGVGFIALFGVAVLNGIVLISYFNELRERAELSLKEIVKQGSLTRMRPVLMTASVAAFGFLPMALSQSAGAEVQKPLATVVIGGLISATILTLVVLPVLYLLVNQPNKIRISKSLGVLIFMLMGFVFPANAQQNDTLKLDMPNAVKISLENHPLLINANLAIEYAKLERGNAIDISPTEFMYQYGQTNSPARDPMWQVLQNFGSPLAHINRYKEANAQIELSEAEKANIGTQIERETKLAFIEWQLQISLLKLYREELTKYANYKKMAAAQYKTGEISLLEKSTADASYNELNLLVMSRETSLKQAENKLKQVMFVNQPLQSVTDTFPLIQYSPGNDFQNNPLMLVYDKRIALNNKHLQTQKSALFPEITAGYYRQQLTDPENKWNGLQGFQLGVSVPLFVSPVRSKILQSQITQQQSEQERLNYEKQLQTEAENLLLQLELIENQLNYFREEALPQAQLLKRTADAQLKAGETDYFRYLNSLSQAMKIRNNFLETQNQYNQTIIQLQFLQNR